MTYNRLKMKIYIYDKSQPHSHDSHSVYRGVTPMCEEGIKNHFEITKDPDEADIYYMGQFSDGNRPFSENDFPFFRGKEEKHYADIEGDWYNKFVPERLLEAHLTINCAKSEYEKFARSIFVRPTFSYLLLSLAKRTETTFANNIERVFSFKGQLDPSGIRMKTAQAASLSGIKKKIEFNKTSFSRSSPGENIVDEYCRLFEESTFSLCPSGVGRDTVRYYESCFYGRIPIVISRIKVFLENEIKPFWFKIDLEESKEEIAEKLLTISRISDEEIVERQNLAHDFFHQEIKEYFRDPTLYYLNWLRKHHYVNQ